MKNVFRYHMKASKLQQALIAKYETNKDLTSFEEVEESKQVFL